MKKILIKLIVFIVLSLVALSCAISVLVVPGDYRNYQWVRGFYAESKNSLDAVFIGGSQTYSSFEAPLAWGRYGIAAWPYTSGAQRFSSTEHIIREARKRQRDAVYVISINNIYFTYDIERLHNLTDYMPMSSNKLKLIDDMAEMNDYTAAQRMELIFPLYRYHSRWKDLKADDFHYTLNGLKGAGVYSPFLTKSTDVTSYILPEVRESASLPDHAQKTLNNLLDYIKTNNVKALFVTSPQLRAGEKPFMYYNETNKILTERGFDVLDLTKRRDELGLDPSTDYYDNLHTNVHGAIKITDYLAKYLVEHYNLTDKRGQHEYESWDSAYKLYTQAIAPYVYDFEKDLKERDYSLSAPKMISAKAYGTSVTIKWEPSDKADGYSVYRKEINKNKSATAWVKIQDISSEYTAYKDKHLIVGTEYVYTVVPFRNINKKPVFGQLNVSTVSATALLPAPKLISLSEKNGTVIIKWKKVLGADGYSVLRREPSGKWKTIKNVGDNNSFTDVPEKQNVAYEYTVRAYNYNALTDTYTYGSSNKKPLIRSVAG